MSNVNDGGPFDGGDELYAGGSALDEAIDSTMKALPSVTAKARFNRVGGHDETDPIERLRFFCSIAMSRQQDWLDVEPFFNDVIAERDALGALVSDLDESSGYWSEHEVPLGIVERIKEAAKTWKGAKLPTIGGVPEKKTDQKGQQ